MNESSFSERAAHALFYGKRPYIVGAVTFALLAAEIAAIEYDKEQRFGTSSASVQRLPRIEKRDPFSIQRDYAAVCADTVEPCAATAASFSPEE